MGAPTARSAQKRFSANMFRSPQATPPSRKKQMSLGSSLLFLVQKKSAPCSFLPSNTAAAQPRSRLHMKERSLQTACTIRSHEFCAGAKCSVSPNCTTKIKFEQQMKFTWEVPSIGPCTISAKNGCSERYQLTSMQFLKVQTVGELKNTTLLCSFAQHSLSVSCSFPFFFLSVSLSLSSCLEWHMKDHGKLHAHASEQSPLMALAS